MAKRIRTQTARFELRCSPSELEVWQHIAKKRGMALSAYIRFLLKSESKLSLIEQVGSKNDAFGSQTETVVSSFIQNDSKCSVHKTDPTLLRQVAAIGNNINQIAHWANAYKSEQDLGPVEEGVEAVRRELAALLAREVGNDD